MTADTNALEEYDYYEDVEAVWFNSDIHIIFHLYFILSSKLAPLVNLSYSFLRNCTQK